MRNAVLVHGKPTKERYLDPMQPKPHQANWFPWIGDKLTQAGISVAIPPFPQPYFPVYEAWREVFEKEQVNDDTGLVGHSAGAEFILRWLSANRQASVEQVVLVAPYRDYEAKYGDFSAYTLDENLAARVGKLTVINSVDDDEHIQRRTQEIVQTLPEAKLVELDGYGHFRIGHNMTSPEFPLLLNELTG